MAIQQANTPDWDKIGAGDAWPQWDEDAYVQGANNQIDAARKTVQGQSELGKMTTTVDENMQGQFATAATETFTKRSLKLAQREGTHTGNSLVMGLSAQNIANTKNLLNAVAVKTDETVEAAKVRWLTSGATQDEIEKEYSTIIDEGKQAVEKIKDNYTQTEESLNSQLNTGDSPEVPSTMPGAPEGGSAPSLDGLDPEVQGSMNNALGQGGGGSDPSSMASMAQGLLSPLTSALSSPPGMDQATQLGQQGFQTLQSLLGQGGGDQVTPEQLDELLANQGDPDDDKENDDKPPREKLENPDRPDGPPPGGSGGTPPGGPGGPGGDGPGTAPASNTTTDDAPSPAAEPVSAAPPASAMQPAVELSSDPNAGNSPQAPAANTGTHLSSGAAATATQAAPGTLGAPAQGLGSGAGLGAPVGGAPVGGSPMGGAPMMGAPMTATSAGAATPAAAPLAPAQSATGAPAAAPAAAGTAAGGPLAPATSPTAGGAPQSGALGAPAAGGAQQTQQPAATGAGVGGVPITSPNPATAGEMFRTSSPFSVDERAAGTIMAALGAQYARGGFTTPMAVAILTDGTKVYCTADGLGYIPAGTHLPADTLPLSEFPSAQALFRADWTGCVRPGYVLKLAADVGLIPAVKVIIATDDITTEGVTRVTRDMLKGAPHVECPITRDMFAKMEVDDAPLAMVALAQEWNYDPADHDAEDVALALVESRWENDGSENAVRALAHHMLMDAHIALTGGQHTEAAYVLKQLLDVPTV